MHHKAGTTRLKIAEKIQSFAALVEREYNERAQREYPKVNHVSVRVKQGKRWTKVDVGDSGKYLVDRDGVIFGIKGYGVPHYGHCYGNLDTITEWDWSGYSAVKVVDTERRKP